MRSGLLHRGRCFTQTNTGPMEKDHPGWKHLNASLRDKVEILAKNPYRFLHLPQRLDVSRAYAARGPDSVLDRGGGGGRLRVVRAHSRS